MKMLFRTLQACMIAVFLAGSNFLFGRNLPKNTM